MQNTLLITLRDRLWENCDLTRSVMTEYDMFMIFSVRSIVRCNGHVIECVRGRGGCVYINAPVLSRTCACSYNLACRESSPFYNPLNDLGTPVAETGGNNCEQVFLN